MFQTDYEPLQHQYKTCQGNNYKAAAAACVPVMAAVVRKLLTADDRVQE